MEQWELSIAAGPGLHPVFVEPKPSPFGSPRSCWQKDRAAGTYHIQGLTSPTSGSSIGIGSVGSLLTAPHFAENGRDAHDADTLRQLAPCHDRLACQASLPTPATGLRGAFIVAGVDAQGWEGELNVQRRLSIAFSSWTSLTVEANNETA